MKDRVGKSDNNFGSCVVCGTPTPDYQYWNKNLHEGFENVISYNCDKCGNGMCRAEVTDSNFVEAVEHLVKDLEEKP